ncbi:hypothetical protein MGYG_07964 [Nannizzia gypsea CBS 118893]|uniref:Ubiquinol-cytochrome-c reductase cytochrome c1 n=1 Tax=Arthroderma gypseum (strain ATCC MYA-4604 / CBS 118893) TaxID=535722 RepID=E4V4N7_ARTGP|nr:hypothetical protein MGYG_07964 [Nannizzia gypsea CBS 118893]EFR04961.1 hypothetical protein MGYG_07964 [Nannizzia gypsea CBS 118893]
MAIVKDERQRVLQAYRSLFIGENALIRKKKAIIRRIGSLKCPDTGLVAELGQEKIVDILQSLLTDDAFASKPTAKVSPSPNLLHPTISDPASPEEPSCDKKELGKGDPCEGTEESLVDVNLDEPSSKNETTSKAPSDSTPKDFFHAPFQVQHLILTKTQTLLEQACFDFALKWAPELISKEMWDCPEAIELSKWTLALSKVVNKIPIGAFNTADYANIQEIIHSGYELRNIAVHRQRVSLQKLDDMMQNAVRFLRAISDETRELQLSNVHAVMSVFMWSLGSRRQIIAAQFQNELGEIQRLREVLDVKEKEVEDAMRKANAEVNDLTRYMLEHSLQGIFGGKGGLGRYSR